MSSHVSQSDIQFRRSRRRKARRSRVDSQKLWSFLFLIGVAGLAAWAVFVMMTKEPGQGLTLQMEGKTKGTLSEKAVKPFKLGTVTIGDTPAKVAVSNPKLSLNVDARGVQTATFLDGGAGYKVMFLDRKKGSRAFRIHFRQTYKSLSQSEIQESLGRKYGRPDAANCQVSLIRGGEECTFRWWLEGSNRLDVQLRPKKNAVELTMIAVNSFLEGRLGRVSEINLLERLPSPLGRSGTEETLPFEE